MLNYRHLYYFWVATKEGGIARAAERLDMAVQTVSTQIHTLEAALGHALFKPCLLYTSPSPRDKRQSRMPSSA